MNIPPDHLPEIIAVLTCIARPPNRRETPGQQDLPGHFDFWFDGGAAQMHTGGGTQYRFHDGTYAHQPYFWEPGYPGVFIRFADGVEVRVGYGGVAG